MNATKVHNIILAISVSIFLSAESGIWDYVEKVSNVLTIRLPVGIAEKKEQLDRWKNDLIALKASEKEQAHILQQNLDQISGQIATVKNQLQQAQGSVADFLHKKSALLSELYQTLFNIQTSRKQIISYVEQLIKLLADFLKDPDFKILALESHAIYSIEDFQNLNKKIIDQEDKIKHLTEQKNEITVDLDNRRRKIIVLGKEYAAKKQEQNDFSAKTVPAGNDDLSFKQRGELLDLEEKLLAAEKQLAELKVEEGIRKQAFIDASISVEQEKLKILKTYLVKQRTALRVTEADVQGAKDKLDKKKQESQAIQEKYYQLIKQLTGERDALNKELEALRKRYAVQVSQVREMSEWAFSPKTVESYIALCDVGLKSTQVSLLNSKIDYLNAQIDLEKSKLLHEKVKVDIITSWYKLVQHSFKSHEEIAAEVKRYKDLSAEIIRDQNTFKDKRNTITNVLNIQNKIINNIKSISQEVNQQKDALFKRYPNRYLMCLVSFDEALKLVMEHIDVNSKLSETYSHIITTADATIKDIASLVGELESKSIWQRSEYAVSWQGVKNIIPDIQRFIINVYHLGIETFSCKQGCLASIYNVVANKYNILFIFLIILVISITHILLRFIIPWLIIQLSSINEEHHSLLILSTIMSSCLRFIQQHLFGITIWATFLCVIQYELISNLFWYVVFYIGSIIYLSYLAYHFVHYFEQWNKQEGYRLFAETYQKRFIYIFSLLAYITIGILFFREAFLVATYHKSELPTILLALYSILIRTIIIFSIGKEELLSLIPARGAFWQFLSDIIEQYYYPLLVCIITLMIISDPYVGGYGNLVSYLLWGIIGTALLIKGLMLLQQYSKQLVSKIFFYTDEEVVRERFVYAKTWYGLWVIAMFVILGMLAIFIGAKIWGKPFTWHDISAILHVELFSTGLEEKTGQTIWFTPLKLFGVIGFIFAGFLLAVAINRYVLRRVFELLPVDLGVQNTVLSLSRYLIIFAAIFFGFQWGGLGWLLVAIGVVIGSIGYIVKEPISDFVSYFIILVQRPIKIGDYIQLDGDIFGVVRQITPRSIIIRKKDSYTIVLPNSMIITRTVYNWNYTRNFIAFDDIIFTVPYKFDSQLVKSVILEVLDSMPNILKSPKPVVRLEKFGENGYEFLVRGFLSADNTLLQWEIASDFRLALVKALQHHNIKIALPTRVIIQNNA